jgi:signal-transduction protein with cAMP-binding, CBS, and nucleotidyltransferase domain
MTSAELHRVPLFASLSPAALDAVKRLAVVKTYAKNTVVATEHDRGDALFVVLSGTTELMTGWRRSRARELGS